MLFIKGIIIGIAKVIPGLSGSVLAISFGIYEKCINIISNPKSIFKNVNYLFPLFLGFLIGIFLISKVVIFLLINFYLPTMLLFIGVIFEGIFKKSNFRKKNILIIILTFLIPFLINKLGNNLIFHKNNLSYLVIGVIDAVTMIIPGLSGTTIMMNLGCYNLLLELFSNLFEINFLFKNFNLYIFYFLGLIITFILMSKLIYYLFKFYKNIIQSIILGFSINSIFFLFLDIVKNNYNFLNIIIAFICFILGFFISFKYL